MESPKIDLIPKGNKDQHGVLQYRPRSPIPNAAKVFEHLLKLHLEEDLGRPGGSCCKPLWLQEGSGPPWWSWTLYTKTNTVTNSCLCWRWMSKTVNWGDIKNAPLKKVISTYLVETIDDCLNNHSLVIDDECCTQSFSFFLWVPQSSVAGHLLWIIVLDDLVRMFDSASEIRRFGGRPSGYSARGKA